jgi:solute carrier family 25 iron transporter 28/37
MNLPFGMIMAAVNESTRQYLAMQNADGQLTLFNSMVSGCIAGGVAAGLTTPLDIVKTRLQTQNLEPCPSPAPSSSGMVTKFVQGLGANKSSTSVATAGSTRSISSSTVSCVAAAAPEPQYNQGTVRMKSAMQVIRQIWREEGSSGFLRGMTPRVMVHAPAVALSWTAYEAAKTFLTDNRVFNQTR